MNGGFNLKKINDEYSEIIEDDGIIGRVFTNYYGILSLYNLDCFNISFNKSCLTFYNSSTLVDDNGTLISNCDENGILKEIKTFYSNKDCVFDSEPLLIKNNDNKYNYMRRDFSLLFSEWTDWECSSFVDGVAIMYKNDKKFEVKFVNANGEFLSNINDCKINGIYYITKDDIEDVSYYDDTFIGIYATICGNEEKGDNDMYKISSNMK